jgi:tRNA(His) guanylyltransferase
MNLVNPYDDRLIALCSVAGRHVMESFGDVDICYGYLDLFCFVFKRSSVVFNRRRDKLVSNIVSLFVSAFVYNWGSSFDLPLLNPPGFMGKIVLFPRLRIVKEYLLSHQEQSAMVCIQNYVFHVLVRDGTDESEAERLSQQSSFAEMNELLFTHGLNYNNVAVRHRRGTLLFRDKKIYETSVELSAKNGEFWKKHPKLLR